MEKIKSIRACIRELAGGHGLNIETADESALDGLKNVINIFDNVEDHRQNGKVKYNLPTVICLTFFAMLAGQDTWHDIEWFCKRNILILSKFLDLPNGTPSHDTFERVFKAINAEEFKKSCIDLIMPTLKKAQKALGIKNTEIDQYCVDGKASRGTGINTETKEANLQTLNVYSVRYGVVIYEETIGEKTNEIPVANKLLKAIEPKNKIITFDALNTQARTINTIVAAGGYFVGGLEANHKNLYKEVVDYFDEEKIKKLKETKLRYYKAEISKEKGKVVTREYFKADVKDFFETGTKFKKARHIILFLKTFKSANGEIKQEKLYYITNVTNITKISIYIRSHWEVEALHWKLDVIMNEDNNQVKNKATAANLSILRKLIIPLLQLMQTSFDTKYSLRLIKKGFASFFEEDIKTLLTILDGKTLSKSIETLKNKN